MPILTCLCICGELVYPLKQCSQKTQSKQSTSACVCKCRCICISLCSLLCLSCALFYISLHVSQKRQLQLSPEQCSDFYAEQYGKLFFPSLTAFMSSGPVIALVLARDQAIAVWKELMGPINSVKARETHPEW